MLDSQVKPVDIPNRGAFFEQLEKQIAENQTSNHALSVIVIKILGLRNINSAFGYTSGDAILLECQQRITTILKPNDFLGRISHNEFALILPSVTNAGHATLALNKIISVISKPLQINNKLFRINLVMGVAMYPQNGIIPYELLHAADYALSQARHKYKKYDFYHNDVKKHSEHAIIIESEIREALENDRLVLCYQPQVSLQTNKLLGVEALLRLDNAHGISPELFIPVVEQTDLMLPITRWTLHNALRFCYEFSKNETPITVSVNLSATILSLLDIVEIVRSALEIWNVNAHQLILEITESAVMTDPKGCLETLLQLRRLGIGLSIDDFGTGYSSMEYLSKLPLKELKIDKSFVMSMLDFTGDEKIVRSIIDLTHHFDLTVVAEGVENIAVYKKLRDMGCDIAQGFFIAKPLTIQQLSEWIKKPDWMSQDVSLEF